MDTPPAAYRLLESGKILLANKPDGSEVHVGIETEQGLLALVSTPEQLRVLSKAMSELSKRAIALRAGAAGDHAVAKPRKRVAAN